MLTVKRVKLDWAMIHDMAREPVEEETARIAAVAGKGFTHDVRKGKKRWRGQVKAESFNARKRTWKDNALLKAMGGVG